MPPTQKWQLEKGFVTALCRILSRLIFYSQFKPDNKATDGPGY